MSFLPVLFDSEFNLSKWSEQKLRTFDILLLPFAVSLSNLNQKSFYFHYYAVNVLFAVRLFVLFADFFSLVSLTYCDTPCSVGVTRGVTTHKPFLTNITCLLFLKSTFNVVVGDFFLFITNFMVTV